MVMKKNTFLSKKKISPWSLFSSVSFESFLAYQKCDKTRCSRFEACRGYKFISSLSCAELAGGRWNLYSGGDVSLQSDSSQTLGCRLPTPRLSEAERSAEPVVEKLHGFLLPVLFLYKIMYIFDSTIALKNWRAPFTKKIKIISIICMYDFSIRLTARWRP